jgi:predicted HicB family RNase H-like nuclease
MKDRDAYLKIVEWSEEDQCYVGSVPAWIGKCCHGPDEMKVYEELCCIVDEWIQLYKKDGRPLPPPTSKKYSGKFVLRIGAELHQALVLKAMKNGESLNSYVVKSLRKEILP